MCQFPSCLSILPMPILLFPQPQNRSSGPEVCKFIFETLETQTRTSLAAEGLPGSMAGSSVGSNGPELTHSCLSLNILQIKSKGRSYWVSQGMGLQMTSKDAACSLVQRSLHTHTHTPTMSVFSPSSFFLLFSAFPCGLCTFPITPSWCEKMGFCFWCLPDTGGFLGHCLLYIWK